MKDASYGPEVLGWSRCNSVYPVADVEASIEWYGRMFGFEATYVNPAPGGPNYAVLRVGEVRLHLLRADEAPHGLRSPVQTQFWIRTHLDGLFEEVEGRGATIIDPPSDRPWGRDFMVADPDRNLVWVTELPAAGAA